MGFSLAMDFSNDFYKTLMGTLVCLGVARIASVLLIASARILKPR